MDSVRQFYQQKNYLAVVQALMNKSNRAPDERKMLGISLTRLGRLQEGELELTAASTLGDIEATVDLASTFIGQQRAQEAIQSLEPLLVDLNGELLYRALRWLGIALVLCGQVSEGQTRLEEAWRGFVGLGDEYYTALCEFMLATTLLFQGEWGKAETLFRRSISYFNRHDLYWLEVEALHKYFRLLQLSGQYNLAADALTAMQRHTSQVDPYYQLQIYSCEALSALSHGQEEQFLILAGTVYSIASQQRHADVLLGITLPYVDSLSRAGRFSEALLALGQYPSFGVNQTVAVRLQEALIFKRKSEVAVAATQLTALVVDAAAQGHWPNFIRAQLHLADAKLLLGHSFEEIDAAFIAACRSIIRIGMNYEYFLDLQEVSKLLEYAEQRETTQAYIDMIKQSHYFKRTSRKQSISLKLFAGAEIKVNGQAFKFPLPDAFLVFVYILLRPGRKVEEIAADLFADKADAGASHVRACLNRIREGLGKEILETEKTQTRAMRYFINQTQYDITSDYTIYLSAVAAGNLRAAINLMPTSFMPSFAGSNFVQEVNDQIRSSLIRSIERELTGDKAGEAWHSLNLDLRRLMEALPEDEEIERLYRESVEKESALSKK